MKSQYKRTTVLGLLWDTERDILVLSGFPLNTMPEKITERIVFSSMCRVFDSLGFISCVTQTKINVATFMGSTIGLGEIDQERISRVDTAVESPQILKIPHWIFGTQRDENSITFHIFVDASQKAYAALFLRIKSNLDVKVHVVKAKLRIAPRITCRHHRSKIDAFLRQGNKV